MIRYEMPRNWTEYDPLALFNELIEAKAAVNSLRTIPYQKGWADKLQNMQLKREVEGTSRIEGAEFTKVELDEALKENPKELLTRSQRQARAALFTYRWISNLPDDRPINGELIREVHRRIVTGADDDHCPPGVLRGRDDNVSFGNPRHRGAEGGEECERAFARLDQAIQREFRAHDLLIQALALHYHFAAIHPFLDGNGRTARAMEALILQRAGLKGDLFIAMSNYYYDEKTSYLAALAESRKRGHDLTPFLIFGLKGITLQCRRLFNEIRIHVSKAMFRNLMYDLFNRLLTTRKRVIAERQIEILKLLLEIDENEVDSYGIYKKTYKSYEGLKNHMKAHFRDLRSLESLGALTIRETNPDDANKNRWKVAINLDWPSQITETDFFSRVKQLPKAKNRPL